LIDLDGEAPVVGEQAFHQFPRRRARELAYVTIEVRLIVIAGRDREGCEIAVWPTNARTTRPGIGRRPWRTPLCLNCAMKCLWLQPTSCTME
jgi:hypothetical protein